MTWQSADHTVNWSAVARPADLAVRLVAAAALLLALALVSAPAAPAAAKPRGWVVNGGNAPGTLFWQVGIVTRDPAGGAAVPLEVFCGGTARDATHVITAAHCVPDSNAGELAVAYQLYARSNPGLSGTTLHRVSAITSHPAFADVDSGNDLALLTLADPLPIGGGTHQIISANGNATGATALISGWGLLSDGGDAPDILQLAQIDVLPDNFCGNYGAGYDPSTMLCAGRSLGGGVAIDTCQGDSGGPLVANVAGVPLIGIVSFGRGCADPNFPGVYTRLANPDLNARAKDPNPPPRAEPLTGTKVQGTPVVGQTLTCDQGQWSQPVDGFSFVWLSAAVGADGKPTDVRGEGNAQTLGLGPALAGRVVGCAATARGAGGSRQSGAPLVGVSAPATAAGAPVPPPAQIPRDLIAPKSRFTRRSCKKRRCSLTVTATDSGGPATKLRVTFKRLTGCKKGKKGRTCRKTRTLKATSRGKGVFTIRTPRLKPAKYRFYVVATDASGNRGKRVHTTLRVTRRG